jgi:hypothetical protein
MAEERAQCAFAEFDEEHFDISGSHFHNALQQVPSTMDEYVTCRRPVYSRKIQLKKQDNSLVADAIG